MLDPWRVIVISKDSISEIMQEKINYYSERLLSWKKSRAFIREVENRHSILLLFNGYKQTIGQWLQYQKNLQNYERYIL